MKKSMNVKDGSVVRFMLDNMTTPPENITENMGCIERGVSAYHLMRDTLLFKKENFKKGEIVKIELYDQSLGSQKKLVNHYTYKIEPYDDISVRLILQDFKITNQ